MIVSDGVVGALLPRASNSPTEGVRGVSGGTPSTNVSIVVEREEVDEGYRLEDTVCTTRKDIVGR
jgi:hypothetical protein